MSIDPHGNIHRVSALNRRVSAPLRGTVRVVSRRKPAKTRLTEPQRPDEADLVGPHAIELAGLLHELSARILDADRFDQALDRLAAFAAGAVPGAVRCSVALISEGGPLTVVAHGSAGKAFDELQYASSTGPGLEAARTRSMVTVSDLPSDDRWPDLADAARLRREPERSTPDGDNSGADDNWPLGTWLGETIYPLCGVLQSILKQNCSPVVMALQGRLEPPLCGR